MPLCNCPLKPFPVSRGNIQLLEKVTGCIMARWRKAVQERFADGFNEELCAGSLRLIAAHARWFLGKGQFCFCYF